MPVSWKVTLNCDPNGSVCLSVYYIADSLVTLGIYILLLHIRTFRRNCPSNKEDNNHGMGKNKKGKH